MKANEENWENERKVKQEEERKHNNILNKIIFLEEWNLLFFAYENHFYRMRLPLNITKGLIEPSMSFYTY